MSFENQKVREFVERFLDSGDDIFNACAGTTHLSVGTITRNDMRDSVDADYHHPVSELSEGVDKTYDVVVYDPPFSPDNMPKYGLDPADWPGYGDDILAPLDSLLRPGGLFIQLGFHTTADPQGTFGYIPEAIGFFNQLGRQDDWGIVVARKPSTEARPSANQDKRLQFTQRDTVVPNQPDNHAEGSFPIHYRQYEGSITQGRVADRLLSQCSGKTLALHWGHPPDTFQSDFESRSSPFNEIVPYRGPADRVHHHSLGNGDKKSDISIHPEDLHEELRDIKYDTVIFWPHQHATNWNVTYNGAEIGYVRAFKRALDSCLSSNRTILLVGTTATGMRSEWEYEHTALEALSGTGEIRTTFITRFKKQQTALGETQSTSAPLDMFYRDSDNPGHWIIPETLDTTYLNPAVYVNCPTCGAMPDEQCANQHGINTVHSTRETAVTRRVSRNGSLQYFQHRSHSTTPTTPHEEPDDCATPSSTTNPTESSQPAADDLAPEQLTLEAL